VLEAWIARDAKRARASLHKRWRAFRDAPLFFEA
jgi:hypothetical protein